MRKRPVLAALAGLPLLLSLLGPAPTAAMPPVRVSLDGRILSLSPAPQIVDGRTLVPVRGVFEAMGATVTWNQANRSVEVTRGDRYVRIQIGSRLACLNPQCTTAATLDVPARLIGNYTFAPVRFIAQAMGFRVDWDQQNRTVLIDTSRPPDYQFARLRIPTLTAGQVISDRVSLRVEGATGNKVQFQLINPETGTGPLIAAGTDPTATYTYYPDPGVRGVRLIVAMVTDAAGVTYYSDPVPVVLQPAPRVELTGLDDWGIIDGPITFGNQVNFPAVKVEIYLSDSETGPGALLSTVGPNMTLTYYPQVSQNGTKWLKAVAYDRYDRRYESRAVPVRVQTDYRTVFSGLQEGEVLTRPRTFSVSVNYPRDSVEYVKYVLDDRVIGWGFNYYFNFGPELNGPHTLRVEVGDNQGHVFHLGPYHFTINTTPQVWVSGIGPGQVVTEPVTLSASSNVTLTRVEYYIQDSAGKWTYLGYSEPNGSFTWRPTSAHEGNQTLQAKAYTASGQKLWSELIPFRVYLGPIYGPKPIVEKSAFKDLAASLAVPSYRETGIAASLQVAQAILETGWGQYVPVDKYTGQFSYNLFGMKGQGPRGSIISNTWEVYNGQSYRVDAEFRAYNNVEESWRDHKEHLLTKPWYAPFREVMTDPVLGAWGLKKSGYATDPEYAIKLINIMKENGLFQLDELPF
ncbi:MAG TPA: stalk domain-containing protein [Symbiobacteriaceae bacterium]